MQLKYTLILFLNSRYLLYMKRAFTFIAVSTCNEWTETSYLQPCNVFRYGYLEAVKKVFK
ncbi:MAG TPA: hypothetical protein DEQ30_04660 [Porphyromonadaceae bacterium]|nr:hypothetical protein [Porphyromonadaceae bacterium]